MNAISFRDKANRANAQRSTGPKTAEGKGRSRANALKHGLAAMIVTPDQDGNKVEEARGRWVDCFNPQDEVALTLADMAFRCKRRMETVANADDAAAALRVREAGEALREEMEREHRGHVELFRNEPNAGRARLLGTGRGCRWLLGRLDAMGEKLEAGLWEEADGRELMAVEGKAGDALDYELASVQEMFDECRRAKAAGLPEAMAGEMERTIKGIADGLRARVDGSRRGFERLRYQADEDLGDVLRLKAEVAKFDASDEGRLRRRYLIDAQREFLKALDAARKASGPAVSEEEVEAEAKADEMAAWQELSPLPVVEEETVEEVAEGSPNEARSGRAGRGGRAGRRLARRGAGRRDRPPQG